MSKTQQKGAAPGTVLAAGIETCLAHLRGGRLDACENEACRLARLNPAASKPHQLVGVVALMKGRLQQAVDALQTAARLNQSDPTIWDNLGVALQRAGHNLAAVDCFQGSVRLDPEVASVWVNAAANFAELGDFVLARNCAARAARLDPDLVEAHLNLGNALRLLGDHSDAIRALLRAIELDPACAPAHVGLSRSLAARGAVDLALKHARQAKEIDPGSPDVRLAYALLCRFTTEVVDVLRMLGAHGPLPMEAAQSLLWHVLMDPRQSPDQCLEVHRGFGVRLEALHATRRTAHVNAPIPARKLRIGFLSGDLHRHPVAEHVLPLWTALDRDGLSIHAYCTQQGILDDDMTAALKMQADAWTAAAELSDDELAARIREDGIDILIDLAGHTDRNRIGVVLRKPAPLQMHWIGYPASTGLPAIDYYIADAVLAPAPDADALFTEKLIRLPCYHSQQLPQDAPPVVPLPALGREGVTFGVTARADKINAAAIALWSKVLLAVADARLIVADAGVADFRDWFCKEMVAHGVDPGRLDFRSRGTKRDYLELHHEIDIVLDTFPFGGGTTVSDALHMGVPTLTLCGRPVAQRMAAARLHAVGLDDWITTDPNTFIAQAQARAQDRANLAALRSGLRARLAASAQGRPELFARAFEAALHTAWQRWCEGLPAVAFTVPAEPAGARGPAVVG